MLKKVIIINYKKLGYIKCYRGFDPVAHNRNSYNQVGFSQIGSGINITSSPDVAVTYATNYGSNRVIEFLIPAEYIRPRGGHYMVHSKTPVDIIITRDVLVKEISYTPCVRFGIDDPETFDPLSHYIVRDYEPEQ